MIKTVSFCQAFGLVLLLAGSAASQPAAQKPAEHASPLHPMPRTWPVLKTAPHFLTETPGVMDAWPHFSPDGKTVLFARGTDLKHWALLVVPAAGGAEEKLIRTPLSVEATRPNWSVKSNMIAFAGLSADGKSTLWTVKADGTDAHAVSAAGLSDQMYYPSWYPDGERLAAMDASKFVIRRVNLADGAVSEVTDPAQVFTGMPSVSPDGNYIAFAGQKNEGKPYDQAQNVIWLVDAHGALRTLEPHPLQGRAPVWSPDGTHLAFESNRGSDDGHYAIFVVRRDGTGLTQITDYALNANHPVWSFDGRQMVVDGAYPGARNVSFGPYPARGIAIFDFPKVP